MSRARRIAFVVVLSLVAVSIVCEPTVGWAQNAKVKRQARKLLTQGDRSLQAGDRLADRKGKEAQSRAKYEEALASYKKAYEVFPQPQIYFAIGNAEEKLGLFLDAHGHYRRLLEEAENPSEKLRAAVEARIEAVLANLTEVTLTAKPDGATIFVDEREIGASPLAEPVILEPGPHRISVRLEGHSPGSDQFVAKAGDKVQRKVVLKLIPKVEEAPPPPPPPPKELGPPPGRWLLITSLIGTGALALGTTSFGIFSITQHGIFSDTAESRAERDNAREKGQRYTLATDIFLGATVVAAGFTAYYYYAVYRPRAASWYEDAAAEGQTPSAWLAPYVDPSGGGVSLSGRF